MIVKPNEQFEMVVKKITEVMKEFDLNPTVDIDIKHPDIIEIGEQRKSIFFGELKIICWLGDKYFDYVKEE